MKFTSEEFESRYRDLSAAVVVTAEFTTPLVGGQPAQDSGISAFVEHHLKLTGTEAEAAVKRIRAEEVSGEVKLDDPEGELDERAVYGLNSLRHSPSGPYLGSWMIHAAIKQAASRLGIFQKQKGSKGDMSEAGRVIATGNSLQVVERPDWIHLLAPPQTNGTLLSHTTWEKFMGRVNTPQGSKSIVHWSECAPAGTRFEFEYRYLSTKVKKSHILDILALLQTVGLGSAKALGRGKVRILEADVVEG